MNELNPPNFIKEAIVEGYEIPLEADPPEAYYRHNKSERDKTNQEFLDEDIRSLEKSNAIKRVKKKPKICHPLQVSHPEGRRKRLIMDAARGLNKFVKKRVFEGKNPKSR